MLKTLQHLLPTGRALDTTADKFLRKFALAVSNELKRARAFFDAVLIDVVPEYTHSLEKFEDQFGLPDVGLPDEERRSRLRAAWGTVQGQGVADIQNALREHGFNVTLHNFWVPGTEPAPGHTTAPTVRNPLEYLKDRADVPTVEMNAGEALALAGEPLAIAGQSLGGEQTKTGYALVNIIYTAEGRVVYTVVNDPATNPFFFYVGGPDYGTFADITTSRRAEFEALIVKLKPAHLWAGMLIQYN